MELEFKLLLEQKRDFDLNRDKYIENVKEIAKKYNLKLYLTGSRARGDYLESSDIDIVVIVPDDLWKDWLKILCELKNAVNRNIFFEFHIYKESDFEEIKAFYDVLREI